MIRSIRHRMTRLLAIIIGAYAFVVMLGWIFGVDQLTRLGPGINMKFVTAFLFFFSALGLYYMSRVVQDEDELSVIILPGISLVIFLVTMTLFISRMLGTPTGIEELFLRSSDPLDFSGVLTTEGWPSFPTMINFMLFGLVGIFALFPGFFREKFLVYSGRFVMLVGCIAVVGYVFNLPAFYYEMSFSTIPMALNTALCFILLGFGLTQIYKPELQQ